MNETNKAETFYRIYGKGGSMKTFRALDLENGGFPGNLMYATFWTDKKACEETLTYLKDENVGFNWKIVAVK